MDYHTCGHGHKTKYRRNISKNKSENRKTKTHHRHRKTYDIGFDESDSDNSPSIFNTAVSPLQTSSRIATGFEIPTVSIAPHPSLSATTFSQPGSYDYRLVNSPSSVLVEPNVSVTLSIDPSLFPSSTVISPNSPHSSVPTSQVVANDSISPQPSIFPSHSVVSLSPSPSISVEPASPKTKIIEKLSEYMSTDEPSESDSTCIACETNKKRSAYTACGHMPYCVECAIQAIRINLDCPICRKKTTDIIIIFQN